MCLFSQVTDKIILSVLHSFHSEILLKKKIRSDKLRRDRYLAILTSLIFSSISFLHFSYYFGKCVKVELLLNLEIVLHSE